MIIWNIKKCIFKLLIYIFSKIYENLFELKNREVEFIKIIENYKSIMNKIETIVISIFILSRLWMNREPAGYISIFTADEIWKTIDIEERLWFAYVLLQVRIGNKYY